MTCDCCGNKENVSQLELEVTIELNCIGVSRLVELKMNKQTIMSLFPNLSSCFQSNQQNTKCIQKVKLYFAILKKK